MERSLAESYSICGICVPEPVEIAFLMEFDSSALRDFTLGFSDRTESTSPIGLVSTADPLAPDSALFG